MTVQQANEIIQSYTAEYTPNPIVEQAFSTLGCARTNVRYVPIVGTAGKSCVATLEASILHAAGFANTGCYLGGVTPLRERITIAGKLVPAKIYTAAVAAVHKVEKELDLQSAAQQTGNSAKRGWMQPEKELDQAEVVAAEFGFLPMQTQLAQQVESLSLVAVEFLVACLCFTKSKCEFAVMELAEPTYAASFYKMPACAITQIGLDEYGHGVARAAKIVCGVLRTGACVVTSPTQAEDAMLEIKTEIKKIGCALVVPELDDFTEKQHRRLQNRMDYGGYEVILPYLGVHATHNAAIAIELALAIWRKGFEISDEAILEGLSIAENAMSVLPLKYRPMLVVDSCHNPLQAAAFAQWVKAEDYQALSLILGFVGHVALEDICAALETGVVVDKDKIEKEQMPGMADHAFEKVYAVCPDGVDGMAAKDVVRCGKFHFDIVACNSLTDALQQATEDRFEGIALCGSPEFIRQVQKKFK